MDTEERYQLKLRIDRKRRESLNALKSDYSAVIDPGLLYEGRTEVDDHWLQPQPKRLATSRDTSMHPPRGFRYNAAFESRHVSYLFARPTNARV